MSKYMNKTRMMIGLLAITMSLAALPAFSQQGESPKSVSGTLNTAEMTLYNYYRDQTTKQIEQILPKGKFGVQVSLKVNSTKFKNDFEMDPIKLPLGGSYVTENELKSSGIVDQSFERLITYVDQVNVIVSIAPGISRQVQELITSSLKSMMLINSKRGDTISFNDLPESIVTAWTPEPNIEIYKKPAMILSGYFGVILMFIVLAMFFGFRQVGKSLTNEARFISNSIKDAMESSTGMGGMQQAPGAMNSPSASKSESFESSGGDFWEKVDVETIAAFCFDAVSQPLYSGVPSLMVGSILDNQKASQLESLIPVKYVNFVGKMNVKSGEVQQIFQKYQSEYRRAARTPMSKMAFQIEMEKVLELGRELSSFEKAMFINSLTPMKRSNLLKTYSTDEKLQLAKISQENVSPIEHKRTEVSLMEKLSKYTVKEEVGTNVQSLNYLTSIILKVESFEEDELMYEKMQGSADYQGVLLAFDCFNQENWEEFNLQDLAIAYCGYSERFKEALIGKFSGKKQEWVKNFLNKYGQTNLEFTAPQVEAVHELIVSKIKNIRSAAMVGEEKHAA